MKVYNGISPCKDCSQRQVGCHGKCDKYTEWTNTAVAEPKRDFYKMKTYKKRRRKQ